MRWAPSARRSGRKQLHGHPPSTLASLPSDQAHAKPSVLQPRWDPLAKPNRLQNVADSTLGAPATRMRDQLRDQLWDHLATTESDRDVLGRSSIPKTPGLKAIPESRRADSNRGPLHYE